MPLPWNWVVSDWAVAIAWRFARIECTKASTWTLFQTVLMLTIAPALKPDTSETLRFMSPLSSESVLRKVAPAPALFVLGVVPGLVTFAPDGSLLPLGALAFGF